MNIFKFDGDLSEIPEELEALNAQAVIDCS